MNSPRTLLQINLSANVGSTGRIAEEIGKEAMGQGWRSVIAYGRFAGPSESELIRVGNGFDIKEHLIETRLFDNHGLSSRRATKKFIKQIEALKPDIIHLHNIHGYYLNYQILFEYLNKTNIPIVWTLHDCWAFTGHCGHFIMANCERWKTGCGHCPITHTEYPKSFVDRSARNYKLKSEIFGANQNLHIVTVSEWLAGLVRQSFLQEKDIRVINNGIDLNVFKPSPIKREGRYRVLGVSNLWSEVKGLPDIVRLRELLDKDKYEIVVVGVSKEQIANLPEGIVGIERTASASELAAYYSSANVFVNTTYADTFPTVNLEALACGTPVVTYKTGGSPESVDAETGVVVEQGDVNAMAEAIKMICDQGKEAYAEACREIAEQKYGKIDRYKDYLSVYNLVMGGGKFVIMGVASIWTEIKSPNDYVRLNKRLAADELLVLVGVDEQFKNQLPKNIIGISRTKTIDDLSLLYNLADVVLSLSKGETFGMTIAEAHACGTPTIVYDNSAQPELIAEGCGYIAPTGDVDAVYECIKKVKELKKSHFSDNCRKHAEICYSKKERYNDYMTLYKELLC